MKCVFIQRKSNHVSRRKKNAIGAGIYQIPVRDSSNAFSTDLPKVLAKNKQDDL